MLHIRLAGQQDSNTVAELVGRLLAELGGEPYKENDQYRGTSACLLKGEINYTVFLALQESDTCIGMISVSESYAVYTLGKFGIIHELFVDADYRSRNIGRQLIQAVIDHGRKHQWSRIEVGTPDREQWQRTNSFYKREGFEEVGPNLRLVL